MRRVVQHCIPSQDAPDRVKVCQRKLTIVCSDIIANSNYSNIVNLHYIWHLRLSCPSHTSNRYHIPEGTQWACVVTCYDVIHEETSLAEKAIESIIKRYKQKTCLKTVFNILLVIRSWFYHGPSQSGHYSRVALTLVCAICLRHLHKVSGHRFGQFAWDTNPSKRTVSDKLIFVLTLRTCGLSRWYDSSYSD